MIYRLIRKLGRGLKGEVSRPLDRRWLTPCYDQHTPQIAGTSEGFANPVIVIHVGCLIWKPSRDELGWKLTTHARNLAMMLKPMIRFGLRSTIIYVNWNRRLFPSIKSEQQQALQELNKARPKFAKNANRISSGSRCTISSFADVSQ